MLTSMVTMVAVVALAQVAGDPSEESASPDTQAAKRRGAERLEFMKKSVAAYELTIGDGSDGALTTSRQKATLEAEPILRWSDIHGYNDGTLFLWTAAKRPVAIAQAFSVDKGTLWLHEFQSLSEELLSLQRDGRPVWTPGVPGIEFKTLADAPIPATTSTQRLSQMHALSKRFAASDDYGNKDNIWQLRLLTRPVYRYALSSEAETSAVPKGLIDGALFAYTVGTDPEMLLLLEARREGGQSTWHYALAPMTCFALTATLDDKSVWECPFRGAPYDRRNPFFSIAYRP